MEGYNIVCFLKNYAISYVQVIIVIVITLLVLFSVFFINRFRYRKFFMKIGFVSYDGALPIHIKTVKTTPYLKQIRFYSKIPHTEWIRLIPTLEVYYRKTIYRIDKETPRMIDIYLIQEQLPNCIEWTDSLLLEDHKFAIGESYLGQVIWDASKFPHGLIAGATGGGKTALLRCLIHQAILKKYNVSILDFKGGGDYVQHIQKHYNYSDLENDYGSILISELEETRELLRALSIEVKGRLECFREVGVSNIDEYNKSNRGHFVPWLLVIDEAAEILDVKPLDKAQKELYVEINQLLRTLARMSRAAGIHILMGFIRPSADVLDGQIKNNLLWRVCGYFSDPAASRIVLDNDLATQLPPEIKGRFIIGEEETQAYYLPIRPTE